MNKFVFRIYTVMFLVVYLGLRDGLFTPWLKSLGTLYVLHRIALTLVFFCIYALTCYAILQGWGIGEWRILMKKSLGTGNFIALYGCLCSTYDGSLFLCGK